MTRASNRFSQHAARLIIALILAFTLVTPVASAQSAGLKAPPAGACPPSPQPLGAGEITVQGWVINHREQAVDGARTTSALRIDAISSAGIVASTPVDASGFFRLALTPDVWNFSVQLPTDWDGIVPVAPRSGLAITGCTPLTSQKAPYIVVFKIRRLFDVTARKWEELAGGTVQPGAGWQITFQPVDDPFAVQQTRTTANDGAAVFTITPGTWQVSERYRPGWTALTPPQVTIKLDSYATPGQVNTVIFKNQKR